MIHVRPVLLAGAFALASCGGEEEIPPTFTNVQSRVFSVSCVFSACHKGASPPQGLSLEDSAYDEIVNVPSRQVATKMRVKPGDADGSYLMDKLLGKQTVGMQMPQEGAMLEPERLDLVRSWIQAGAPND